MPLLGRSGLVGVFVVFVTALTVGQSQAPARPAGIRSFDFTNFTYASKCGQDTQNAKVPPRIHVIKGQWKTGATNDDVAFTIRRDFITYGDVTNSGHPQAVVVSTCGLEGVTWAFSEIYVFDMKGGVPSLLGMLPPPDQDQWGWGYPNVTIKEGKIFVKYEDGGSHAQHENEVTASFAWNGNFFVHAGTTHTPLPQ